MIRRSIKEINAVVALDAMSRFEHFVKRIADEEHAWGLWDSGWVLMEDDNGKQVFPLWPAYEYADLCCSGAWSRCEVREISLADILGELIPKLIKHNLLIGIFPTEKGNGIITDPQELAHRVHQELEKYANGR